MASRSTVLHPISQEEQDFVLAYLVAISPTLQQTVKLKRAQETRERTQLDVANTQGSRLDSLLDHAIFDPEEGEILFTSRCSMCHSSQQIALAPPASNEEAKALVLRMVQNGLRIPEEELSQIIKYIQRQFVNNPALSD